jgi:hypothetical protein
MLDFLIDNIFVLFSGWVFQQAIGIYMYLRYEFRVVRSVTICIKAMFGSFLLPIVGRRDHVLFTLSVFACA